MSKCLKCETSMNIGFINTSIIDRDKKSEKQSVKKQPKMMICPKCGESCYYLDE